MTAVARRTPAAALPPLYGDRRHWALIEADALALLGQLPPNSIDAVVTDPPYGLAFNGEHWDGGSLADGHGFQAFTNWWAAYLLRALKPGAHVAAFGAPRTVHRLVAGFEDAGFEVRDQLLWCFGSGVPKSRRMAGGLGSSLKPAYEPIVVARKPLDAATSTIAANVARHGTGALNIDAARVAKSDGGEDYWPANLALGHDDDCDQPRGECVTDCVVPLIDRLAADNLAAGSAPFSRLFYAAKATRAEREAGCEQLEASVSPIFSQGAGMPKARANIHPTVKPLDLMRWLVRLVTPIGGTVLDPFTGSGSTGIAAVLEGRQFVGIEREADYIAIARARMTHWAGAAPAREPAA